MAIKELIMSRFWSLMGQASAVFTVLAGIYGIAVYITEKESLELYIESSAYNMNPLVRQAIDSNFDYFDYSNLQHIIQKSEEKKDGKLNIVENEYELINILQNAHKESWGNINRFNFDLIRGFNFIVISNTGNRTANKINIDFPGSGVALVINQNESQEIKAFTKVIQIEDIRPNNEVFLFVWSENLLSEYDYKKINLTHDNGKGKIVWKQYASGVSLLVLNHPILFIFLLYAIFSLGVIFGHIVNSRKRS